jgi:hypothetical protein
MQSIAVVTAIRQFRIDASALAEARQGVARAKQAIRSLAGPPCFVARKDCEGAKASLERP